MKEIFRILQKDAMQEKFTFGEFVVFGIAVPVVGCIGVWMTLALANTLLRWVGWL